MSKDKDERIPIDEPIQDLNTVWDDGTYAYTGARVEAFIKQKISEALEGLSGRFGDVKFEGSNLSFYDEDGGRRLAQVTLAGTSYIVTVETDRNSAFYVLNSETEAYITITPSTKSVDIGSTVRNDYPEGYTYSVEIDSGSGYVDRTPADNVIAEGGSARIDVRTYLRTGDNKIRIVVVGQRSEQPKTVVLTASLTSLKLSCDHPWHQAWVEGQTYAIGNIFLSGNLAKTLHVKIGDAEYTQLFSASTQHDKSPYSYDLSGKFPSGGTGVYDVEVWLTGGDVSTDRIKMRLMCVAAADVNTARLICINRLPDKAVNYSTQTLFQFATYNLTQVTLGITADLGGDTQSIVTGQAMTVQSQTRQSYTTSLQIDTELQSGLSLGITLSGGGATESATLPLDNSNAYIATAGATFYLNPSLRANNRADREEIHNTAPTASVASYAGEWDNFTFEDDAWATDPDGHKALSVMAGSELRIPDLAPLNMSATSSLTIELMYRASNIADYDKPIFSIMSTAEFDADTTRGIVLLPTRLYVLTSIERQLTFQKLDLSEDRITHLAIVLQRNYSGIGRHLCHIYVNGRENVTFEYSGTSEYIDARSGYNYVRMGQQSTDLHLYMLRTYDKALEGGDVINNYINALIETSEVSKAGEKHDNNIMDGGELSYDLAKRAGFNTLVYETDDELPSLANPNTDNLRVNMLLEYANRPEWCVNIYGIPMAGQGTTSMKYYMWNFDHKIKDNVRWEYPNILDGDGNPTEAQGKDGYIAGYGLHPKVSRITAKKNVASSPQGHKMGACAMYHELFVACEGTNMLPGENCRVAIYQQPFLAFQKYSNGTYRFIGLFTVGPSKKDKKTFGYNAVDEYPSLMMLEGPNHAPYMTRFLVPWTDDVFYDYANETLSVGDSNHKQEGWDADIVADYSADKASDAAAIMALYESEFKPAYDAIYYTSPYIASLAESGKTLAEINADVPSFQNGTTRGYRNELMTFYNSNYELIYYRVKTGRYEALPLSVHNLKEYLNLSGNPTTDEILAAREAKFADTESGVFKYVSKQEALFHAAFCELLAVSDNDAKNTYWRKFLALLLGGKWGFNQDDMDTLFQNDNNGQDTKEYFVEPGDVNPANDAEIFQGSSSAFWTQLRRCCQTELRDKMQLIVTKSIELAGRYNCSAPTVHETLLNLVGHYFWSDSAKYFPAAAYNEDTLYAYINVWSAAPDASYNNVRPLTQVHGDHYETERAWMERRIAYIFSKYRLGGFTGSDGDGYGTLEFTPSVAYNMQVTPAIDLYPRMSVGGGETETSQRTKAGDVCTLPIPGSSDTTMYVKGVDWLSDLGDLHNLRLASRGGSSETNFAVRGKRLRRVVVGSATEPVTFNASSLAVGGESVELIDARNAATVTGKLELYDCSRLKRAYFGGTNLRQIMLPIGGRVNEVQMPESLDTLFLHSLNLLEESGLSIPDAAYRNIANLYINKCNNINPIHFLTSILARPENRLKFVTMVWDKVWELGSCDELDLLAQFVRNLYSADNPGGVGALSYEGGQLNPRQSAPDIQGRLSIDFPVYEDSVREIMRKLPNLTLNYDPTQLYIRIQDPEVLRVLLANGYGDGTGVMETTAQATRSLGTIFRGNTTIETFDEFEKFGVTGLSYYSFEGCTSLRSIRFPNNSIRQTSLVSIFKGCSALSEINLSGWDTSNVTNAEELFDECYSLNQINVSGWDLTSCTSLAHMFSGCRSLVSLDLTGWQTSESLTNIAYAFYGCCNLQTITGLGRIHTQNITSATALFTSCGALKALDLTGWDTRSLVSLSSWVYACPNLRWITLSPSFFSTKITLPFAGLFMSQFGFTEANSDNGWLAHLVEQAPTIRPKAGYDPDTDELLTEENGTWYLNDGVQRTIQIHKNLYDAPWAESSLADLAVKGYAVIRES